MSGINLNELSKNIVIVYADINIEITDGSTIWLSNLINTYGKENKQVYFLNAYKNKIEKFCRNIIFGKLFEIINCNGISEIKNTLKNMSIKYSGQIEKIIIRSKLLLDSIDAEYDILEQLTIYGLPIHLENVLRLNNKFKEIWAQSEKIKDLYVSNGIQEDKIQITPPMGWKYDFELEPRKDDEIRLIYVGTLRDEENILEIIEEFRKIHIERPEVKLKIVYGKINGNKEFTEKIEKIIREGIEGIEFKNNLTHKETCYEIATSDIGICWRKNGWGEDGQTSTKEQEYINYNNLILSNLKIFVNDNYIITKKNNKINVYVEDYCIVDFNKYSLNDLLFYLNDMHVFQNFKYDISVNCHFKNNFKYIYKSNIIFEKFNVKLNYKIEEFYSDCKYKVSLYKNVIYKIKYNFYEKNKISKIKFKLFKFGKLNDDIFRNCYVTSVDSFYFTVKESGEFYIQVIDNNKSLLSLFNYVNINYLCDDNIYILNLKNNMIKYYTSEKILNDIGINCKRFEAIDGHDKKYDNLWNNYMQKEYTELEKKIGRKSIISRGSLGYLLSMKKMFEIAIENKFKYLCVIDDDIMIEKNFDLENFNNKLLEISDFNILKFGSSQWDFKNLTLEKNYYNANLLSNGSFFNIYKNSTFENILCQIEQFDEPFDFKPLRQYIDNKYYILYPNMIIANLDHVSSITNKTRENDYVRFKWNKNLFNCIEEPFNVVFKSDFINKKTKHFLLGIVSFNRDSYLLKCFDSLVDSLDDINNFTIVISYGITCDYNCQIIEILKNKIQNKTNIRLIFITNKLHYIYFNSNVILKCGENIDFDYGFILNDDILFTNDWYNKYYQTTIETGYEHLCFCVNNKNTIFLNKHLKTNGNVILSNGVILTFNKNIINDIGFFDENNFKLRGQSHLDYSLRCCRLNYNNENTFYDYAYSNDYIKLQTENYESTFENNFVLNKAVNFIDIYELEKRLKILNNPNRTYINSIVNIKL